MKIGILLGSPGISGGTYVIYEHAFRLKRKGHHVFLITKQNVHPDEFSWHSYASDLEWLTLDQAKFLFFDFVIATWWKSPFILYHLKSIHYVYFVQSIETRFFDPVDPANFITLERSFWQWPCEKTYSYNLPIITEARWIQEYLKEKWNNWPYLVKNGIRKDIYTVDGRAVAPRQNGLFRVLVEGPVNVGYKNVSAALRLAKQAGADEVWLMTSSDIQQYQYADRIFSRVPIHETPEIYRSCDIILKLSYVEGMFGPPLEMFHCGGTALVYDVTGHDEYIVHNQNAYVVNRDNEEKVFSLLRQLKDNPAELERLKEGAIKTAGTWPGWEECSKSFEQVLVKISSEMPASRKYLKNYTEEIFKSVNTRLKAKTHDDFSAREKDCRDQINKNNFSQFYWDKNGNFSAEKTQWKHYIYGEFTEISFNLTIDESPIWLRFDPSVRIGIIEILSIVIINKTHNKKILSIREDDEFETCFLSGDIKWIISDIKNLFFSFGNDPVIILPMLSEKDVFIGDEIELIVKLKETSIYNFLEKKEIITVEKQNNNALKLYWSRDGNFNKKESLCYNYLNGEWFTASLTLLVENAPLWLRLDLSYQVGFIEIASLVVRNTTRLEEIMAFRQPDDFQQLLLTGSLTWLAPERRNILLVGGPSAICVLPKIEQERISPGDFLEITVTLRESSPQQFAAQHHVRIAEHGGLLGPFWKKILRSGARRLGLTKN